MRCEDARDQTKRTTMRQWQLAHEDFCGHNRCTRNEHANTMEVMHCEG